ncbi:response regulator transcription factor [Gracilibacillus thailandensis]|jgi:DNA-binding response OmpR family regulator|uniref:Response regulator n=1 Tax=Gracilibacillus thailandensis TaxID=563735 RepID=A0A6N7R4K6_9BACI|nr:response regulator transcription factor [Gracilibacillus thailandensis]MRI68161.1 response regulator [Gracilibacillus thailandensis]
MSRVLYIEDESEIGSWVSDVLREKGYEVIWLTSGDKLNQYLSTVDIAILDIMLPGLDGFSIGKRIKRENADLPVIMLSARTAVEDKLEGLSFADDYVTKPFHPEELVARIEVMLRRFQKNHEVLHMQHLEVYPKEMRIIDKHKNEEIQLTGKQFYLFQYFLQHANQILTKEQLYEGVWGEPYMEGDKTLMVHIRYLREKLEVNPAKPTIIETIRGIGYRVRA